MTDVFQHPDGHHYRFIGFGAKVAKSHPYPYYMPAGTGYIIPYIGAIIGSGPPVFERVEPPLWPWAGPSGTEYYLDEQGDLVWLNEGGAKVQYVPRDDFAGLAERLAKQAELNKEQA